MKIRSQISMVFHLDKCIGCHTCSIACKNIWTDRQGAEYMWWNNVETKPGTGFPTLWEDQEKYKGGWELKNGKVELKMQNRAQTLGNLFSNPALPTMDDITNRGRTTTVTCSTLRSAMTNLRRVPSRASMANQLILSRAPTGMMT